MARNVQQPETEQGFQDAVVEFAQLNGWKVAHFRQGRTATGWSTPVAYDGRGFPDLVLVRERVVFVECKAERGALTKEQKAWRDAIEAAGDEWYCWRPGDWDEVQRVLGRH